MPKPAELEIYLGENGMFYRLVKEPSLVVAGEGEPAEEPAGVPLFMF